MTVRVWDDAVVEAAAQAIYSAMWVEGETRGTWRNLIPAAQERWRNRARVALTAAADAVEGAIRAEALAPVAALADEWDELGWGTGGWTKQLLTALRAVLGDPDAAAKHNAAVAAKALDDAAAAIYNGAGDPEQEFYDHGVSPWLSARADSYRTTEGTADQ